VALVFKESNHISEEIKALPCFVNHLCEVERVTGGESHACFKVTLSKNDGEVCYFVKSFSGHQETAKAEVSVNLLAAEAGLAPAIIYYSPLWLVCEFIYGDSLAKFTAEKMSLSSNEKIRIAMHLMVKAHQLIHPQHHRVLHIEKLLSNQVTNTQTTELQRRFLRETIKKIIPLQRPNNNVVLCHGDVNYENIRLSDSFNKEYLLENSWLVDYECSFLAEVEYDIAMFIAVNTLSIKEVNAVIEQYTRFSNRRIDNKKVHAYLACCYLINGLWYVEAASEHNETQKLINMAREQLVLFDQLALIKQKVASFF
jgi:thiamine kinase-like enzyme